jgi:hypothetical protein
LAEVAACNAFKDSIVKLKKNLEINRIRIGELDKVILNGVSIP